MLQKANCRCATSTQIAFSWRPLQRIEPTQSHSVAWPTWKSPKLSLSFTHIVARSDFTEACGTNWSTSKSKKKGSLLSHAVAAQCLALSPSIVSVSSRALFRVVSHCFHIVSSLQLLFASTSRYRSWKYKTVPLTQIDIICSWKK